MAPAAENGYLGLAVFINEPGKIAVKTYTALNSRKNHQVGPNSCLYESTRFAAWRMIQSRIFVFCCKVRIMLLFLGCSGFEPKLGNRLCRL